MSVPAGWYPDPVAPGVLRYWMGTTWSESTQPVPVSAPVMAPVMTPVRPPVMAPAGPPVMAPAGKPAEPQWQHNDDVFLPAGMVEWGHLPSVCVKHGRIAVQMPTTKVYSRTPIWVIPFIIFGLLIGLIIALAMRVTVAGIWPVCGECVASRKRRLNAMWGCLAAIPSSIALSVWLDAPGFLLIGLIAAPLGALVFGASSSWTGLTKATVDRQSHAVRIRRPARGFVAALPNRA
jgi:hypothetical protein